MGLIEVDSHLWWPTSDCSVTEWGCIMIKQCLNIEIVNDMIM